MAEPSSFGGTSFLRGIKTYGDPRNPPILFLHGIRLGGAIWDEHARALSDAFYTITPDLPGHGALADLPFEIPVCDALLAYITEELTAQPPLIVGYSLGGYLAMRYATDLPERTAGLILTGCSTDIVGRRQLLYEIGVAITAQFSAAFVQRVLAVFFRLTLPPRIANIIVPFPFNQRVFESSRKLAGGVRYSEKLAGYGKPVLIVNGEWDLLFRPDEALYAAATGGQLAIMERSDHVAPLRRPAEFTGHVRRFAQAVFGSVGTSRPGRLT